MSIEESFITRHQSNVDEFYNIGLGNIRLQKILMGTECTVESIKKDSKYSEVFGSAYTSNSLNDSDMIRKNVRLLINFNLMSDRWNLQQPYTIYDREELLQRGDVVIYARGDNSFRFKVTSVKSFSDRPQILYEFTLEPSKEIEMRTGNQ